MSNYTQTLEDYETTLANWHELGEEEYKASVDELQAYYEDYGDYSTGVDLDIYNRADSLIGDAERFYEDEARQEELEQELDERRYEGARHLS